MRKIIVGKKYRHFKGHIYKVINIARDSETLKDVVVYQDISDTEKIWVRDYEMFASLIDKEKYPNIGATYRFEEINE